MLPALDQIDFRTLRDQANQSLRAALRRGQFESGRKMTIRGFSAALGVSPTPIREALHGLAAEAAIVAQRGKRDVKAMIRAIGEFHFTIYRGSARPILGAFVESLWLRGQTLAAIRRGDAKAARASMERDIAEAADFVIAISKSDAYRARLGAAA